jgi:hypothetical protein
MTNDLLRLYQLRQQGFCCTQIMIALGLEARGETNGQMVDTLAALCGGLHKGLLCGALSGAACLLYLFDKENATREMIPELVDWFEETYTPEYGGINCYDIVADDIRKKSEICPQLIELTYLKAKEILNQYGHDLDELWDTNQTRRPDPVSGSLPQGVGTKILVKSVGRGKNQCPRS